MSSVGKQSRQERIHWLLYELEFCESEHERYEEAWDELNEMGLTKKELKENPDARGYIVEED